MLVRLVFIVHAAKALDLLGAQTAAFVRERKHLVAAGLDGAGLMHGDVARVCGDHALPRLERRGKHGEVGLRAAHQKVHMRFRRLAQIADNARSLLAVFVFSIAWGCVEVGLLQAGEYARVRAFAIVAIQAYQAYLRLSAAIRMLLFYHSM